MSSELSAYKRHLESQPWYGDLMTVLVAGVCHVPNEYYPYIMDALEQLGKFSKVMRGETDDFTYIYGEPVKDNPDDDSEYPFVPTEPDSPKEKAGMKVAEEILRQLGGREFITMTGSKNLISDGNTLRMCLAKNMSGANRLFITYHHHPDAYEMRFFYYRAPYFRGVPELGKIAEVPEVQKDIEVFCDVCCDMLRPLFERVTGFDTHMPRVHFENTFEYGGRHFSPLRKFKKGETDRRAPNDSRPWKRDMQYAMRNMRTDRELNLSVQYSHEQFYDASGGSKCDIFKCAENGRLYVPCESELYQYTEPETIDEKEGISA